MTIEFVYCDKCNRKIAIKYQDADNNTVCCLGEQDEVIEVTDVPYDDADTFSWLCCCGYVVDFAVKNVIDPTHYRIHRRR